MTTDDRDDRIDELLREALQEEADTVVPSGDGLSRIQSRVRSGRSRWTRPALVLGSVALLAAAGVGAYALTNGSGDSDSLDVTDPLSPSPSQSESASPSPSTEPVVDQGFPKLAIFPFTTAEEERAWEESYADGHEPWKADPTAVAQFWVQNYLGEDGIDEVVQKTLTGDRAKVTLGRTMQVEQKATVPVTTVRLVQYGKGWIVVGADDPQSLLSLSSPANGATVTSPVTVTGPGYGVDEAAAIKVFDSSAPGALGVEHVSYGNGTELWSTAVSYDAPATSVGAVVAVQDSAADGGPQRLVAQQVRFGASSGGADVPQYFYAVKNQRIAKFASRNGAAIEYLTELQPGGGPTDPQVGSTTGDVYYLEGSGTCSNSLARVTTDPQHKTSTVASPDAGYVITGFGILEPEGAESDTNNPAVAYYEQSCFDDTPQAKLVMRTLNGEQSVVKFKAEPPGIVGDPTWQPDGEHVVAILRGGMNSDVRIYDAATASDPFGDAGCGADSAPDGEPTALEIDATNDMWVAKRTGSSMVVATCAGDAWHEQFSVPGNDQPADVDATADGGAVLLTDADGKVWRWDGSGDPTKLSPSVPLDHVTW